MLFPDPDPEFFCFFFCTGSINRISSAPGKIKISFICIVRVGSCPGSVFFYIFPQNRIRLKRKTKKKHRTQISDFFILTNEVIFVKIGNSFFLNYLVSLPSLEKNRDCIWFLDPSFSFFFSSGAFTRAGSATGEREISNFSHGLGIVICKNLTAKNQQIRIRG